MASQPGTDTRADRAERTRRSALDTARRLFAENGYAATSLQQIADAMGVQKANVYYYFRTKQAILDELLGERVVALEALMHAAEAETDRERRLELVIAGFVAEVVTAHREIGPINFADPAVRTLPGVSERLDALSAHAVRVLFGSKPTADELAGFAMAQDLKPALSALSHLPDRQLREALTRLCRRLLPA